MATDVKGNEPAEVFKRYDDLNTLLKGHRGQSKDVNLYKHLAKLMSHIVQHCPNDALNKIEEVSYLVKLGDEEKLDCFLKRCQKNLYAQPSDECTVKTTKNVIDTAQTYFKVSHHYSML